MNEQDARAWIDQNFSVSRETWAKLEGYVAILLAEMGRQNLIAESTRHHIWARHIADSAQLLKLADGADKGVWVDLGSGAGLPGIVIACLSTRPVLMVESRRKRVDFLKSVVADLAVDNATVFGGRVETVAPMNAAVISARAYAPLPKLFASALHLSDSRSLWVLPKGRSVEIELEAARRSWQAVFHVKPSVTDADSAIVLAHSVKPIAQRKGRA